MCLAVPGKLVEIDGSPMPEFRMGVAEFAGVRRDVSLAFTPEANVGDYVLVHAGVALSVIDEQEAHQTLDDLRRMAELAEDAQ